VVWEKIGGGLGGAAWQGGGREGDEGERRGEQRRGRGVGTRKRGWVRNVGDRKECLAVVTRS